MRNLVLGVVTIALLALALSGAALAASSRIQICHIPPGNPANFHTITVSEKAVAAHLAHGDLLGGCFDNCEVLCDDGNACTIDACDPVTETCQPDHPPVDCVDSDLCTIESCDPLVGCLSAPMICDDDNACTANLCADGSCVYPEINCGDFNLCDPTSGCYDPCGGVICEPVDLCHEAGLCAGGECLIGDEMPNGTSCNDGSDITFDDSCQAGVCTGVPGPMYFNFGHISGTGQLGANLTDGSTHTISKLVQFDHPYTDDNYGDLTAGAQEIISSSNEGGSAVLSEAFSYEILASSEGATLLKTGTEILYEGSSGKKTDYSVQIDGLTIGVSATRVVVFPPGPISLSQAQSLLTGKLEDIIASTEDVSPTDQWIKQILHVFVSSEEDNQTLTAALETIDASVTADTVVILTTTSGEDSFLY